MHPLKQFDFFKDLSDDELKVITFHTRTLMKNEIIGHRGEKCHQVGFIISGEIDMESINENGDLQTMAKLTSGDCFGETLIFTSKAGYPGDVVCKGTTELILFSKAEMSRLIMSNEKLFHKYATLMADKVTYLTERVRILGHKTLREKITTYLNTLSMKQGTKTITLPMSKEKLAVYLGTIRPSLVRELTNMKDEGLIDFDRKTITLLY